MKKKTNKLYGNIVNVDESNMSSAKKTTVNKWSFDLFNLIEECTRYFVKLSDKNQGQLVPVGELVGSGGQLRLAACHLGSYLLYFLLAGKRS